jgi:hypothetical protein
MRHPRVSAPRLGFLAHELRNLVNTAILAFEVLQTGDVGVGGSTGMVLQQPRPDLRAPPARSQVRVHDRPAAIRHE